MPRSTHPELADWLEINHLLVSYCYLIDEGRADELPLLFTDDCTIEFFPGAALHGRDDYRRHLRRRLPDFAATSHHLSNVTVDMHSADLAEATSYVEAWHQRADGSDGGIIRGRYRDTLVRTSGRWLISRRVLVAHGTTGFDRSDMIALARRAEG